MRAERPASLSTLSALAPIVVSSLFILSILVPACTMDPRYDGVAPTAQPRLDARGVFMASYPGSEISLQTEQYDAVSEEGFLAVLHHPFSTFSLDVDTASYSNVRRFVLREGRLPPKGAVRIEELVNYFPYDHASVSGEHRLTVTTEVVDAPWAPAHRLVMIGVGAEEIAEADVPPRNLVFLVDVSGSMQMAGKLALVKSGLRQLVSRLRPEDRVSLVVYAGASGMVLPPTSGADGRRMLDAIEQLEAGGSTNGGQGIALAYALARRSFDPEGVNRVILASDGDFNVGVTSRSDLVEMIERERESGVFLTVLGVGTGNLKDATMEELADRGNGNYAYLDSLSEAHKVLVQEAGGTLVTVAKDVKIQVEFNPTEVSAYRLIGYDNRRLEDRDFNDDEKDAGDLGAGHSVTAIYEVVPVGVAADTGTIDPPKYQRPRTAEPAEPSGAFQGELMTVKLRYKLPDQDESRLLTHVVDSEPMPWTEASVDTRFGAGVALFGMLLRGSQYTGDGSYTLARDLAEGALGQDEYGYRSEFVKIVEAAGGIAANDGGRGQVSQLTH